jgi:hypothetical protein
LVVGDPLGLQGEGKSPVSVHVFNNNISRIGGFNQWLEGSPQEANNMASLIRILDAAIASAGGSEKACVGRLTISAHSGVGGLAPLAGSEQDIATDIKAPDLSELAKRMCKNSVIVLRMCNAGSGRPGSLMMRNIAAATGCTVVAYTCDVPFGFSPWLSRTKTCSPDGNIQCQSDNHACSSLKPKKPKAPRGAG